MEDMSHEFECVLPEESAQQATAIADKSITLY